MLALLRRPSFLTTIYVTDKVVRLRVGFVLRIKLHSVVVPQTRLVSQRKFEDEARVQFYTSEYIKE